MTAAEIIEALRQVAPDTRVTVVTAESSGLPVEEVKVSGYCDGAAVIVAGGEWYYFDKHRITEVKEKRRTQLWRRNG